MQKQSRIGFLFAMLGAGVAHFVLPKPFIALIPRPVPRRRLWVYLSGAAELLVALGLARPAWRYPAALANLALLVLYTPIHVVDLLRDKPIAGGRRWTAALRLLAQFGLLALARDLVAAERAAADG